MTTLLRDDMANKTKKGKMTPDFHAYIFLVSVMLGIIVFDLQIAMFAGLAWVSLLILWHMRHDVDGSLTHSRYLGKVVVGA